jgi:2-furoyl-CoA dehydrogenase large subunit
MQLHDQKPSAHLDALSRIEDAYLLRGEGQFVDDLPTPSGTLYAAIVRSPVAHGEIRAVRTERAAALNGVVAILTIQDIEQWSAPFIVSVKTPIRQWCLAKDRVRYVGEPIAVVIASSRAIAEDGVELVDCDIAPFPAVVDSRSALLPDTTVLHEELGTNCIVDRTYEYGDIDSAFDQATHVVETDIFYPRNSCTPIECGGIIASYRAYDDSYDVTSNFMGPFSLHVVMSNALGVPGNRFRHRYPRDSGGSFGVKQALFPYVVLICLASRKAGATVKYIEDRLEHLLAATSATSRSTRVRAAVDTAGKISALDFDQIEDCGAYLRAPEPATLYRMHSCMTGAYDVSALRIRNRVVLLNKTPTGLVRGFGGAQVYFALERLIQKIARVAGKSVPEIMALNFISSGQFPFHTASGGVYDSGDYMGALQKLQDDPRYGEILSRQAKARSEGRLYGVGYAAIVEPSISNMGYITTVLTPEQRLKAGPKNGAIATATVSVDPSGAVTVKVASAPAGQGHQTVAAQIVANNLGLGLFDIVVNTELDTQKDAWFAASGNYSSRFAGAVASAVHIASQRIRDKMALQAAATLGCDVGDISFETGRVMSHSDPNRSISFARLAGTFHWAPEAVRENVNGTSGSPGSTHILRETAYFTPDTLSPPDDKDRVNASATYGFVLDVCGVEIDKDTCKPKIDSYISLHDAGKILNPLLADGQVYGAFAQAVGASLYEELSYDASGNFMNGTFADYRVPTASEVPQPKIIHYETPSPITPLGSKGIAEGNSMSTPVCLANAIADAIGIEDVQLPAYPYRIYEYLVSAGHVEKIALQQSALQTTAIHEPIRNRHADEAPQTTGEVLVSATPEEIFTVLMDPERLKNVIPGCEAIQKISDINSQVVYTCRSVIRIGVVKAGFDVTMRLSDIDHPNRLTLTGSGCSGIGTLEGVGLVTLSRRESKTLMQYRYNVSASGKLAAVGGRLLDGTSRLVLGQLFKALSREAHHTSRMNKKSLWARLMLLLGLKK